MTREEARDQIVIFMCDEQKVINDRDKQALEMAIQALEQSSGDAVSKADMIAFLEQGREYISRNRDQYKTAREFDIADTIYVNLIQAVEQLPSVKPQEPKYCDRNICMATEYNGIGCDECEVTKSKEPSGDAVDRQWLMRKATERFYTTNYFNHITKMIEEAPSVNPQIPDQWYELKETITEMRDNDGTASQQDACKFLVNYMDVLEKQMQEPKTGHWILADEQNKEDVENDNYRFICSECQCSDIHAKDTIVPYCWKCGCRMVEPQESEEI